MKILSLKSVLLYQLGSALLSDSKADEVSFFDFLQATCEGGSAAQLANNKKIVDWCEIPLKEKQQQSKNVSQILYVSALPQAISALSQVEAGRNPLALSQVVVNRLNQSRFNLKEKLTNKRAFCSSYSLSIEAQLWLEFEIGTQKLGWITFCLSHQGLCRWLQHIQSPLQADILSATVNSATDVLAPSITRPEQFYKEKTSSQLEPFSMGHGSTRDMAKDTAQKELTDRLLWQAQYTYACCARLEREHAAKGDAERLALREDGSDRSADYLLGQMHCDDWQSEYAQSSPAARLLICTLVNTSDSLFWIPYRWPTQQYLLLLERAKLLCQAFEQFYRVCLCGSQHPYLAPKTSAIAHKPLNQILVRATKNILECLLQEHLGEKAPEHI